MIPEFDDNGYLPPGIHPATFAEIQSRFGGPSEIRRVQVQSLGWLLEVAARAGIRRIVIDGSFVTDAFEPNDVDGVLLADGGIIADSDAWAELQRGLPFLEVKIVDAVDFDFYVSDVFATDRDSIPKGMIEVIP